MKLGRKTSERASRRTGGRGLAQTKAGLTTFRLGTVSWLECGPLAALVCSVQRPNAGSASPTTRWSQ